MSNFCSILLAKKLKECDVFRVSSDEYLNYTLANWAELDYKGQEIVVKYLEACKDAEINF